MSVAVKAWLSVMLLLLAVYGSYSVWRIYQVQYSEQPGDRSAQALAPRHLAEFEFTDSSGETFRLKQLEGRIWVGSFFFASCPGFCLQMNREIAALSKEFSGQDVTFVSITVDPLNDTPEQLRRYAGSLSADLKQWRFLSGPMADVQSLGQDVFKVTVQGKEHSDRLVLVDRQGKVVGRYSSLDLAQLKAFTRKLRSLLQDDPKQAEPKQAEPKQAEPKQAEPAVREDA